jgi:hypothetical protein
MTNERNSSTTNQSGQSGGKHFPSFASFAYPLIATFIMLIQKIELKL